MKKLFSIFLFLISLEGNGQSLDGFYYYQFYSGGDQISDKIFRLLLENDKSFKLFELHYFTGDTILISYGKYFKNNDTLSFLSPLPNNIMVIFYPEFRYVSPKNNEYLRLSINHTGDLAYAALNSYSFYAIDINNNKTKVIPSDTAPNNESIINLMTLDLNIYFSFFLEVPFQCKYLMICSGDKNRYGKALNGCETIDISNLRTKNIAIKKDKVNMFNFKNVDFFDLTDFEFIIKNNELISTQSIYPEGKITFLKE